VKQIENEAIGAGDIVYFVRCRQFVKIGRTRNFKSRLAELGVGNPFPMELVWFTRGHLGLENHFHKKFAHLRHKGEWFEATRELEWANRGPHDVCPFPIDWEHYEPTDEEIELTDLAWNMSPGPRTDKDTDVWVEGMGVLLGDDDNT